MLFFSRAAGHVATFLSIFALLAIASPGKALDLDRAGDAPAITTTGSAINPQTPKPVPSLDMSDTDTASPDEVRSVTTMTATGTRAATLAAAVAARGMPETPGAEMTCLAAAVFHESANQPLAGQLAVANVLLNRVKSGRFASTVCGVLTQPGQFSFVRRGVVPTYHSDPRYRTSMAIAQVALDREWADPAPGALYFHATYISPGWKRARVATIGQHVFYR